MMPGEGSKGYSIDPVQIGKLIQRVEDSTKAMDKTSKKVDILGEKLHQHQLDGEQDRAALKKCITDSCEGHRGNIYKAIDEKVGGVHTRIDEHLENHPKPGVQQAGKDEDARLTKNQKYSLGGIIIIILGAIATYIQTKGGL